MVARRLGWCLWLLVATCAAAAAVAREPDLLLEVELDPAQVVVQAQTVYRLRFYQAVDVSELKIVGPSARLADVRPIGAERRYEALREGRRYRVSERRYAIFPFGSGALELGGAHVLGRVVAADAKSGGGRRTTRLDAPLRTLTVAPVPATASAASWLPARALSLSESWVPAAGGSPVQAYRRHIRIEARGLDAGQIPQVRFDAPGMILEAEPPRLENRFEGELNVAVREQDFRLVAPHGGDFSLPELRLSWWDITAGMPANATLPARTLHVAAATELASPPATTLPSPQALAAAALLCAVLALAYAKRQAMGLAWRLWRACRRGNSAAVRDGLLRWAAQRWPREPPATLEALAERLSDPVARLALGSIDRSLYGPQPGRSNAATLRAWVRAIKDGSRNSDSS